MSKSNIQRVILLASSFLFLVPVLSAQIVGATLNGTVRDTTGAAISARHG